MSTKNKKSPKRKKSQKKKIKTPKKQTKTKKKQQGGDRIMPWHKYEIDRTDLKIVPMQYKGQHYTLYVAPDENELKIKLNGIVQGIKKLVDSGITLPPGLRIYLITDEGKTYQIMTEAIQRTDMFPKGDRIAFILISSQKRPQASALSACGWVVRPNEMDLCNERPPLCPCHTEVFGGVASTLGLTGFNLNNWKVQHQLTDQEKISKVMITTIHEVGHLLHEINATDLFWKYKGFAKTAMKVSVYAAKSWKEFVAEVFTAQVLGMPLDNDVVQEYQQLGGPAI